MTVKRYLRPFANNAVPDTDITFIPDVGTDATAVNYQTGYNARYSLQYGVNPQALPVERQYFNGLVNEMTSNLMDVQLFGFPEWYDYTSTSDPVLTYSVGSLVRYRTSTSSPYQLYRCIADGTQTVPTDATKWETILTTSQTLAYMGLVNQYPDPATVPDTGDFNSVPFPTNFRNGIYEFNSDAKVQGWANSPPTQPTARAGVLEVYCYLSSTPGQYIYIQRYSDRTGQVYARSYNVSTASWTIWANLTQKGGATGAGDDKIFWLNDQTVTASYNIPSNQNAMTAGPITINNGVTVTVPNGSTWTVV